MASYDQVAWGLITGAPSPATSGTSLTLTTGSGARFPATSVTYEALVYQLTDPGVNERVRVTARSTDVLTIVRNVDSRGAQTITSSGWAIMALHTHGLVAMEGPNGGLFVNQASTNAAFAAYAPASNPAKSLQTNDGLHHKQSYDFINGLGGAHTFTLTLGFGLAGVAQGVFATLAISVPANTTYVLDVDVMVIATGSATQGIVTKVAIYNSTTGAVVNVIILQANGTFDTAANAYHFNHTGQMDASSASLTFQGYNSWTTLVRGS